MIIIVFIGTTIIKKIVENAIKLECDKNNLEQKVFQLKNSIDKNINVRNAMKVNESLKGFVSNTQHVIDAQIYKCYEKVSGNIITYIIDGVDYKYVRFGEAVNDIRETYKVNKKYLDRYRQLKKVIWIILQIRWKANGENTLVTKEINNHKITKVTDTMINILKSIFSKKLQLKMKLIHQ